MKGIKIFLKKRKKKTGQYGCEQYRNLSEKKNKKKKKNEKNRAIWLEMK